MSEVSQKRARALAELHQHHPSGLQCVLTLEFSHPAFDVPARVVADNADLDALLETGEAVTFQAVAFTAIGPGSGEGRWPEIEIAIDNAARLLEPHLEAALGQDTPISITFREYIRQLAHDGPGRVISGFELDRTVAGDFRVTGTAGFHGLDKRFGTIYDPARYPSLR